MGRRRARALLLALAGVAGAALALVAAAAAAPPPLPDRPAVEVYGFAPGDPPDPPDPNSSYDWSVLTTVAWRTDRETVAAARAHGRRVDLDARAGVAEAVARGTVADAARWVAATVSALLSKGLDGVNFDLESPIDDPAVANAYTGLVAATAAAAKAATLGAARVTVDVPFLPYDGDGRDYDYAGLAAAADALFVMAYDMQALMFGRCVAAANAPLPLVERAVDAWLALGVPADKLILGLPWYGYTYECIDDDDEEEEEEEEDGRGGSGGGGDARDLCRIAPVPYAGAPCSDAGGQQIGYAQIMERESLCVCGRVGAKKRARAGAVVVETGSSSL
jgi:di-N-acetylchitobiase